MKVKKTPIPEKKVQQISIFARPWFVIGLVVICFAILTPKIFMPLMRQLLGYEKSPTESSFEGESNGGERFMPPNIRSRGGAGAGGSPPGQEHPHSSVPEFSRSGPQFSRKAAYTPAQSTGGSKSFLSFLLPVYAIGIGIYMIYTLFKVFNKDGNEKTEKADAEIDEESDRELKRAIKPRFRERPTTVQGVQKSFQRANNFSNTYQQRSEESEDEENDYERYKGLDPDYVNYLKETRAQKRDEARKKVSLKSKTMVKLNKIEEIPLTSNIGLTSITNTNVLMNDTLERMKYSLNKINLQLGTVEKKGGSLDDPELEGLRLQLTQTELQMAKIMNIVSSVSSTIQTENKKFKSKSYNNDEDTMK